ncbi:MAG TPA: HAMP domain-containing sensor histidine kinase [Miltoncostaeaceae bacterium]|nr:HAMP domain-containing sensor histidine kinase [Miltoncostaeaceae bacterium]
MRRRLVVAIMLVAAGTLALFAIPLALSIRDNYRDEELLRLQRDAVAATRQIDLDAAAGAGDRIELPASTDAIAVYGQSGPRLAGRGPYEADATVAETLRTGRPTDASIGGELIASAPLVVNERIAGAVRVARDGAVVTDRTQRSWLRLAGLAAAVLVAALLAAVALGRWLARPLERVAITARRLGDGDFDARADRSGVPEIDAVGEVLEATAQRLEQVLARERAFTSDASHQLRTPLAALRIELEAMGLREGAPPELEPALAQVDRLQATIDTLLSVARDAPSGGRETDIAELLERLEERWRPMAVRAGRRLRVEAPPSSAPASISPSIADEVLSVLIENALTHGAGTITVGVLPVPGGVTIRVADQGSVPELSEDELFARRPPHSGGHGIGLALARSLTLAEGGTVNLTRRRPTEFSLEVAVKGVSSDSHADGA